MVLHVMQDAPAWLDLSGTAVKLLLQLIRMSKGNNGFGDGQRDRGRLFLSVRDAATAIGVCRNTAAKAFGELIDHGFLRVEEKGHFDVKGIATTWRLTFQPYPHRRMGPTNEWRKWTPPAAKNIRSRTDDPRLKN
jgi:DNA-binding transcriptional MocR family regulator